MDALGLVCESHRSTEALTSEEMDLIRHFLPLNLNSQSPGGRQQTVSLLKKVSFVLCCGGGVWLCQCNAKVISVPGCHLKHCSVQLLCRMKDSAVLLQKRLTQEQADGDRDTLQMYKVTDTLKLISLLITSCVSFAVCSLWNAGVPSLVLWDAVGGFASWCFLLKMPHVHSAAVFTRADLHL